MKKFITIMIMINCAAMFSACASSPERDVYPENTPYYGSKTTYYPQEGMYPERTNYVDINEYDYTPRGNTYYRVASNY